MDNGFLLVGNNEDRSPVFLQPQNLIKFNNKNLSICFHTLNQIKAIKGKVFVTSIIGPYRSGKSWLLSLLADCPKGKGFGVSDGMTSYTKGIWVYCKRHPENKDIVQLFCDTEGLHDAFKENATSEDNRLFTLGFLISKMLIYNVQGICDSTMMEKLAFVSMLSEKMQATAANKVYPEFVLVLRDVSQTKLKLHGTVVEPSDYLQQMLSEHTIMGQTSTRRCIKEYCPNQSCFRLNYPTKSTDDLENIETVPLEMIHPNFKEDVSALKNHISTKSLLLSLSGGSVYSTQAFTEMIRTSVEVLNRGEVPELVPMYIQVAEMSNNQFMANEKKEFSAELRNTRTNNLYQSLQEKSKVLENKHLEALKKNVIRFSGDSEEIIERFKKFTEKEVQNYSKTLCEEKFSVMCDQLKSRSYKSPGAVEEFRRNCEVICQNVRKDHFLGPQKKEALEEFANIQKTMEKDLKLQDYGERLLQQQRESSQERENDRRMLEMEIRRNEMDRQRNREEAGRSNNRERNNLLGRIGVTVLSHLLDFGVHASEMVFDSNVG